MIEPYLHLSVYACAKCKGPVVSGWYGRRESSITKEVEVGRVAGVCLSCGDEPAFADEMASTRHFPPVAWPAADIQTDRR